MAFSFCMTMQAKDTPLPTVKSECSHYLSRKRSTAETAGLSQVRAIVGGDTVSE
jgi:hypothetical protein